MPSFILTRMAIADLKNMGRYTQEKWGSDQRNTYLAMLDASFRQLAGTPLQGKDCGTIVKDTGN